MAEKTVQGKAADTGAVEKPVAAAVAKPAAAKPVAAKPAAAKPPAAKAPAAKPAPGAKPVVAAKAPVAKPAAVVKPAVKAVPVPAKPSDDKTLPTPPPVPIPASDLPTEETVVPTEAEKGMSKKDKKAKVKAPKPPKKPGKGTPFEKWLCLGTLIISSLLAMAFLADVFAGFPFGGSTAIDIVSFLGLGITAYLAWETGREY